MLRQILLATLLSATAFPAFAGSFDFLPAHEGKDKEFRELMNSGNFRAALITWSSAHGSSAFGRSQSGTATLAYLLYQNGMPLSGLELLVSDTKPSNLNSQLLKVWTVELKKSHWIQKGWVPMTRGWKSVHNNDAVSLRISSKRDVRRAFAKASALPRDNVNQKARIWWQIATKAPLAGEIDSSLRALKLMKESGQTVIGQDQIASTYARVLYQKGDIDAALNAFLEIPKSSSLWVESVEERAWAYLRKDDYDTALGQTVTLLSPALAPLVGPESYYLANLLSLKVCDYPRIFKNSELFKKRHKDRLESLQALAKTGTNKNLGAIFERFEKGGVSIESAGHLIEWIPRAALRDQKFLRFMETRRAYLNDIRKASDFAKNGDALGGSQSLSELSGQARAKAERMKQLAFQRIRDLARAELQEYTKIINKLHIVEGEVIHRLAVDESLKNGERSKLAKVEYKSDDVLVFPYNSDEVWMDELDNYKARVKDCPTLKGAGL